MSIRARLCIGDFDGGVTDGTIPYSHISSSSTNCTLVKRGQGCLVSIMAVNLSASVVYLKFYDMSRDPEVAGLGTPLRRYAIPASTTGKGIVITPKLPTQFYRGLAFTLTGGAADNDTTAISVNDVVMTLECAPGAPDAPATQGLTGLDWSGTGPGIRQITWNSPLTAHPATYLWKVFQRNQVTSRADGNRYYSTFFHGNNGTFNWGAGDQRSYYGCHPYPTPPTLPNPGDGKWEVSVGGGDTVTRDDASAPFVVNDQWYSQACTARVVTGTDYEYKFYVDLPSVATSNTITVSLPANPYVAPPSPALMVGQAPNLAGKSWGGYDNWEEQNAIIRGFMVFASILTETQIVALSGFSTDAQVIAYCAAQGLTLWYLNMNWTVGDITDKSGAGHHPAWTGSSRPTLWTN